MTSANCVSSNFAITTSYGNEGLDLSDIEGNHEPKLTFLQRADSTRSKFFQTFPQGNTES